MGCLLACFGGSSKDKRRRKLADRKSGSVGRVDPKIVDQHKPLSSPTVPIKQDVFEEPACPISDSGKKSEEQSRLSNQVKPEEEQLNLVTRKQVTFDLSVKTIERVSIDELPQVLSGIQEDDNENFTKLGHSLSMSESGSTLSTLGSYPPNHRYQNCRESDDDDEFDCQDSDLVDDDDVEEDEYEKDVYDEYVGQQLSCGSFSSMESRTKSSASHMVNESIHDDDVKTTGLKCSARDRSCYIHPVLNPVENVTQWKAVKAKGTPRLKQQKENFALLDEPRMSLSMDPSPKKLSLKSKPELDGAHDNRDVAVDASLSTWIVPSQKTPTSKASMAGLENILSETSASSHGSNSLRTPEYTPILGALTAEELKQLAVSGASATQRSSTHSPDNMPMVGAAGTRWSRPSPVQEPGSVSSFKGLPNTTSKYREDKTVTWHSTPFESRLERALNKGAAVDASDSDMC